MAPTENCPHGKLRRIPLTQSLFTFFSDSNQMVDNNDLVYHFRLKFTLDRQDFADTAVINVCSNFEYKPVKTTLWTISIHLNIVGHSFAGMESSEIVAQYATLPIGMFSLSICPHDPNK